MALNEDLREEDIRRGGLHLELIGIHASKSS